MNERSLAPEQQAILSLLNQGERYRYKFVDTVGIGYSRLAEMLNPLIQQRLVIYYFEPDGAQRFKLTPLLPLHRPRLNQDLQHGYVHKLSSRSTCQSVGCLVSLTQRTSLLYEAL